MTKPGNPNFKNGKPAGSGRAPGTPNHKTILLREILDSSAYRKKIEEGKLVTPISFWLEILNPEDPTNTYSLDTRLEAAKNLAPYIHSKAPVITETTIITPEDKAFTVTFE